MFAIYCLINLMVTILRVNCSSLKQSPTKLGGGGSGSGSGGSGSGGGGGGGFIKGHDNQQPSDKPLASDAVSCWTGLISPIWP